jgi:RNA polymerase sporulation-specific sigma factor
MCKLFVDTYDNLTDSELIYKIRENDEDAFKALSSRYSSMIYGIVNKYASNSETDDLMQEANISFYYATQFFDFQSASFSTFSRVCVERGVITAVKKAAAKKRIPTSLIVSLNDEVITTSEDPEQLVLEREAHEAVSVEITNRLSKLELKVLKSFLITGSYDETATELGLSKKSVDNALCRVRKKLDSLK